MKIKIGKLLPKPAKPIVKKLNVKNRKITIRVDDTTYFIIKAKANMHKLTITDYLILKGMEQL
jgi:uncharacterized protein (DUF1778 family)